MRHSKLLYENSFIGIIIIQLKLYGLNIIYQLGIETGFAGRSVKFVAKIDEI